MASRNLPERLPAVVFDAQPGISLDDFCWYVSQRTAINAEYAGKAITDSVTPAVRATIAAHIVGITAPGTPEQPVAVYLPTERRPLRRDR